MPKSSVMRVFMVWSVLALLFAGDRQA